MLDVLRRSSEQPAVRSALRSLLTSRLDGLLEEAAAEPAARFGDQVEAALRPLLADPDVEGGMLVRCLCVHARALLGRQRAVEALAQAERAADLCDELDEPVGAAMTYAVLGATLAALHRPHDALEAIAWSQAEHDRAMAGQERAMTDQGRAMAERAGIAVDVYDQLLEQGVDAVSVHTGRAMAGMSLGAALTLQGRPADAVLPLSEALAALERFASGDPVLMGHLANGMLMLGDALIEAGRVLEASVVLHRATQVIEDDLLGAVAQARLDFCQAELSRREEAEEARAADPRAYEPPDSACRRAHR
jgi:tetratricopeptide (TPR) repeat protein